MPRHDDEDSTAVRAADMYGKLIDFVVEAGAREQIFSTVVDWSSEEPCVLREGAGSLDELGNYIDL